MRNIYGHFGLVISRLQFVLDLIMAHPIVSSHSGDRLILVLGSLLTHVIDAPLRFMAQRWCPTTGKAAGIIPLLVITVEPLFWACQSILNPFRFPPVNQFLNRCLELIRRCLTRRQQLHPRRFNPLRNGGVSPG